MKKNLAVRAGAIAMVQMYQGMNDRSSPLFQFCYILPLLSCDSNKIPLTFCYGEQV